MDSGIHNIHKESVDSTNNWLRSHLNELSPKKVTCLTADIQTAGKGQRNKHWISPKGNLYTSFCFSLPNKAVSKNIPQILSISCMKLLQNYNLNAQIKWPNDILIEGEKIAGILGEVIDDTMIVGIGVNVNMDQEALKGIDQPATSLFTQTNTSIDIHTILQELQELFLQDLKLFFKEGFSAFHDIYTLNLAYLGQEITWFNNGEYLTGILRAVLPDGSLEICPESNECVAICSGHIQTSTIRQ